jgi:GT2 family glycosyltransferase
VRSLLGESDTCEFSINILAHNFFGDVERCVTSVLKWSEGHNIEVLIVDSSSTDETGAWADDLARRDPRVQVIHTDHNVGEGPGRNIGLKQSRGKYILILDTSIEFRGDALTPVAKVLENPKVGATGGWGVSSEDLRHFEAMEEGEVDAIEGYCLAFRRDILNEIGLLDEKFRFYRNLDLDFCMALRDKGYTNVIIPDLPLNQHEHRGWSTTDEEERDKLSRKNFYRFLGKWGNRTDLLLNPATPAVDDGDAH